MQSGGGVERRPEGLLGDDGLQSADGGVRRLETGFGSILVFNHAEPGSDQLAAAFEFQVGDLRLGLGGLQLGTLLAAVEPRQQLACLDGGAGCEADLVDGAGDFRLDGHRANGDRFADHLGGGLPKLLKDGERLHRFDPLREGGGEGDAGLDALVLVPA